jgi:hypothetical protein
MRLRALTRAHADRVNHRVLEDMAPPRAGLLGCGGLEPPLPLLLECTAFARVTAFSAGLVHPTLASQKGNTHRAACRKTADA